MCMCHTASKCEHEKSTRAMWVHDYWLSSALPFWAQVRVCAYLHMRACTCALLVCQRLQLHVWPPVPVMLRASGAMQVSRRCICHASALRHSRAARCLQRTSHRRLVSSPSVACCASAECLTGRVACITMSLCWAMRHLLTVQPHAHGNSYRVHAPVRKWQSL